MSFSVFVDKVEKVHMDRAKRLMNRPMREQAHSHNGTGSRLYARAKPINLVKQQVKHEKNRCIKMNQVQKGFQPSFSSESFENFSRAVDEIRLRRNLEKLNRLMNRFELSQRPQYLIDEIASQEEQLRSIRKKRNG